MTTDEIKSRYSPIEKVRIQNFMAIEDSTITFSDNMVNLKGMNSRGKSATIKALRVLMTNYKSNKQRKWIKWGMTFFGITMTFFDGLSIYYEKRSNGKSCYEISDKLGNVLFTTRQDGVYAPIVEVPEPVRRLVGIIKHESLTPNFMKSREPLFIVDTTGKTNYEFLNSVLETPEVTKAQELLKEDLDSARHRNSDLSGQIRVRQDMLEDKPTIDSRVVDFLVGADTNLNVDESKVDLGKQLYKYLQDLNKLVLLPDIKSVPDRIVDELKQLITLYKNSGVYFDTIELPEVQGVRYSDIDCLRFTKELYDLYENFSQIKPLPQILPIKSSLEKLLVEMNTILGLYQGVISTKIYPELPDVNASALLGLNEILTEFESIPRIEPKIPTLEPNNLDVLTSILDSYKKVVADENELATIEKEQATTVVELNQIQENLKQDGLHAFRCSDCGHLNVYDDKNNALTMEIAG